jgi:hypothetical protein
MTYNPQALDETPDNKKLNEESRESLESKDYYFIDYDNESDHEDDLYHVLYGTREDLLGADFVASFLEDADANEYIEFKNDLIENDMPKFLEDISDEEYEDRWYNEKTNERDNDWEDKWNR